MSVIEFQTKAERDEENALQRLILAKLRLQETWEHCLCQGDPVAEDWNIAQAVADANDLAQEIIGLGAMSEDSMIAAEDVQAACDKQSDKLTERLRWIVNDARGPEDE